MPGSGAALPKAPNGFFGVVPQAGVRQLDTNRMKRGRVTKMRLAVSWGSVQPDSARSFNWTPLDASIRAAARSGIRVMPTLYGVPSWINRNPTRMPIGKNRLRRWRQFIRAAVLRYGHGGSFWREERQNGSGTRGLPVREWQIWNEPNFHYFATPVSPARYARLVRGSAHAIRSVNPNGRVVLGGLFGRPKGGPAKARHASTYLRQLRHRLNPRWFDAIAIHPYAPDTRDLRWIMRHFRRTAVRAGLRRKPIYITELGWASGPRTNAFMTGSKRAQAKQLRQAFAYLIRDRHRLKLRQAYWFAWQDTNPRHPGCSFCGTIGLFSWHPDRLKAKPAWRSFVKFTRGRP